MKKIEANESPADKESIIGKISIPASTFQNVTNFKGIVNVVTYRKPTLFRPLETVGQQEVGILIPYSLQISSSFNFRLEGGRKLEGADFKPLKNLLNSIRPQPYIPLGVNQNLFGIQTRKLVCEFQKFLRPSGLYLL